VPPGAHSSLFSKQKGRRGLLLHGARPHVTVTVAVAEPPLLLVAVPTYVPGRLGTAIEVPALWVCPGCSWKLLVYEPTGIPSRVMFRVTLTVAACVPQLVTVPATVKVSPGFTVTLLLPFTVSVSGTHCAWAGGAEAMIASARRAAIH